MLWFFLAVHKESIMKCTKFRYSFALDTILLSKLNLNELVIDLLWFSKNQSLQCYPSSRLIHALLCTEVFIVAVNKVKSKFESYFFKIVTNDQDIANIMNNYFTGITSHLNLKPDQINRSENLTNIIENFKNHESIQRIKLANFHHRQTFNFRYVSIKEVKTYPPRKWLERATYQQKS